MPPPRPGTRTRGMPPPRPGRAGINPRRPARSTPGRPRPPGRRLARCRFTAPSFRHRTRHRSLCRHRRTRRNHPGRSHRSDPFPACPRRRDSTCRGPRRRTGSPRRRTNHRRTNHRRTRSRRTRSRRTGRRRPARRCTGRARRRSRTRRSRRRSPRRHNNRNPDRTPSPDRTPGQDRRPRSARTYPRRRHPVRAAVPAHRIRRPCPRAFRLGRIPREPTRNTRRSAARRPPRRRIPA
jgi:hypothetical protein